MKYGRWMIVLALLAMPAAGWGQAGNKVQQLWVEKTAGKLPDVVSSTICWWYLNSLYGLAARAGKVAVCKVAAVTPLAQPVRVDFGLPGNVQKYTPWLPPQTEPADAVATVQVQEALVGCNQGDSLYVLCSTQRRAGAAETCHPTFVADEQVLLFLRQVDTAGIVPGTAYATVNGLNGAWVIQWPGQQPNPFWQRDAQAVRAVCSSLALSPSEQLQQWRQWLQSDNYMLRLQGLICAIAMERNEQVAAARQGFAWEYTRYAALCLIWILNDPTLDAMVEAQYNTFPDTIGWMSLKIAWPIMDRNWARHRQAQTTQ